jgi:hypothetical protein
VQQGSAFSLNCATIPSVISQVSISQLLSSVVREVSNVRFRPIDKLETVKALLGLVIFGDIHFDYHRYLSQHFVRVACYQ